MSDQQPSLRRHLRLPLLPAWIRGLLAVITFGILLYYSIVPAPGSGSITTGPFGFLPYSAWLHLLAYMGLTIVFAYATAHANRPTWQLLAVVFVIVVSIGTTIELLQYMLPTRTFSWVDIGLNAVGAAIGLSVWAVLDRTVTFYRLDQFDEPR